MMHSQLAQHWFAQSLIELKSKQMNETQINPVNSEPVEVRLCYLKTCPMFCELTLYVNQYY